MATPLMAANPSCKAVAIKAQVEVASAKKPSLIMIHSLSSADLWLTHSVSDTKLSSGWSSRLQPRHWSVFALNKALFEVSCIESKPGHEQQIPCKEAILLCQYFPEEMPKSLVENEENYWAVENITGSALNEYLSRNGFKLPDLTETMVH